MKNCIFISAGDRERFASFATENLINQYDIIINYYGNDDMKLESLKQKSTAIFCEKTTKFISLKKCYDNFIKNKYEWVAVFDDDAQFISGSIDELIDAGKKYELSVVSGSHSGKISYPIHRVSPKKYKIRFTNFVEMNFPVFLDKKLALYMSVYDGGLCGWGNDWWYCNVLGSEDTFDMGILDSVVIHNPNYEKGEMDSFMSSSDREKQFKLYQKNYNIKRWIPAQLYK